MKKSLLLVIGCLITTVSVNASQFYTDENTQYDSVHFLMLDEQNKPLTGLLKISFDEWKMHKEINYVIDDIAVIFTKIQILNYIVILLLK